MAHHHRHFPGLSKMALMRHLVSAKDFPERVSAFIAEMVLYQLFVYVPFAPLGACILTPCFNSIATSSRYIIASIGILPLTHKELFRNRGWRGGPRGAENITLGIVNLALSSLRHEETR
jgi:hypothetical protein